MRSTRQLALGFAAACAGAASLWAGQAQASEGGASLYLLGAGGPDAAVMPPVKGVFFDDVIYYYSGSAGGGTDFPLGGNIVADLDVNIIANFSTVLWVPSTDFLGGTLALGGAVALGQPEVNVSAVVTGPFGGQLGVHRRDQELIIGDPLLMGQLGWHSGDWHWAASGTLNIPIGQYNPDRLANLSFHRWAFDASLAGSWHNEPAGWDVSAKTGFTFNGENEDTQYTTGTEWHVEAAVERTFNPQFSAAIQGYYFQQVSDDTGAGATLGPFRGRVAGVGATAAYNFHLGHMPATIRLRAMHEFDAENRLEGDSVWFELTTPMSLQLPPGAPGG